MNGLSLAAAPTFALMALLSNNAGNSWPDSLCSASQHPSPLAGMVTMYVLMSVFHSSPWLRSIVRWRRSGSRRLSVNRP